MIKPFPSMALGSAVFLLAIGLAGISPSLAQSCPANLSDLDSQIETPGLRARLWLPLEPIIEQVGSLDEAIARTQSSLLAVQARRATALAEGRDTRSYDDAILIFVRQIEAFECRKTSG
jgi:hypothetical protein